MYRITSRGLVAGLGVLIALSLAAPPLEAQKTSRSSGVSRSTSRSASTVRVSGRRASSRRGTAVRVSGRAQARSGRSSARSASKLGRRGGVSRARSASRASYGRGQARASNGIVRFDGRARGQATARRSGGRATTGGKLGTRGVARSTGVVRITGGPDRGDRAGSQGAIIVGGRDASEFRNRRELEPLSRDRGRRTDHRGHAGLRAGHGYGFGYDHAYHSGFGYGYGHGYSDGYRFGLHLGYHLGYSCGAGYYDHRCSYAHLGYYYGGFGYFGPHWSFVMVLGAPARFSSSYTYQYYTWYNGRRTRLYGWNSNYAQPAAYRFDGDARACVALRQTTVDGAEQNFRIDPTHYEAEDPGDLYALLWAELEERGQLEIEDLDGSVHIFPADQIREIEASKCRY